MTIRRLVVGTVDGRSVVLNDGLVPRSHDYEHVPGFSTALVWATTASEQLSTGKDEAISLSSSFVPGPGETRLEIVTFPPDSIFAHPDFSHQAAFAEQQEHLTGMVDHFDPDRPGMHSTPSVDYGIVLEGTIWLELDDGVTVKLEKHNVIIQQGNIHAWRNQGDVPATLAFVLVGTNKQ